LPPSVDPQQVGSSDTAVVNPRKRAHRARLPLALTIVVALAASCVLWFWPSEQATRPPPPSAPIEDRK
jgi:hypothetical protein